MKFHNGELAVQRQAGVEVAAARVGNSIHTSIPGPAADFVARQPLAFVGSRSDDGKVWASILSGSPGHFLATDDQTVSLGVRPGDGDPLLAVWRNGQPVGLLFIEPGTRRRMRVNGQLSHVTDRAAEVKVMEVYANCPKYIQAREWIEDAGVGIRQANTHSPLLTERQQGQIAAADTFFIASSHAGGGSDVSHRGGNPGFVRVDNATMISFPDYSGNNMFNTLGNLTLDPHSGLLFIDYTTGTTLQVTGLASISWDSNKLRRFPGAERVVEFEIQHVVETPGAVRLNWRYLEPSPFNPV